MKLETRWRKRLEDARLQWDFARTFTKEAQQAFKTGDLPLPDGSFAFQKTLRTENMALAEYRRVLQIYTDLIVKGQIPDESEWLRKQAENAGGSEGEAK